MDLLSFILFVFILFFIGTNFPAFLASAQALFTFIGTMAHNISTTIPPVPVLPPVPLP